MGKEMNIAFLLFVLIILALFFSTNLQNKAITGMQIISPPADLPTPPSIPLLSFSATCPGDTKRAMIVFGEDTVVLEDASPYLKQLEELYEELHALETDPKVPEGIVNYNQLHWYYQRINARIKEINIEIHELLELLAKIAELNNLLMDQADENAVFNCEQRIAAISRNLQKQRICQGQCLEDKAVHPFPCQSYHYFRPTFGTYYAKAEGRISIQIACTYQVTSGTI